jgi:hypothetical protein
LKEREREQEQEKFVEHHYSREDEAPTPWCFDDVILNDRFSPVSDIETVNDEKRPFYQLNSFRLYRRSPIHFPQYLACSSNYFNPKWIGERRLKNVVCVLEYIPRAASLLSISHSVNLSQIHHDDFVSELDSSILGEQDSNSKRQSSLLMSATTASTMKKASDRFDIHESGVLPEWILKHVVHAAMDLWPTDEELDDLVKKFGVEGIFTEVCVGFCALGFFVFPHPFTHRTHFSIYWQVITFVQSNLVVIMLPFLWLKLRYKKQKSFGSCL